MFNNILSSCMKGRLFFCQFNHRKDKFPCPDFFECCIGFVMVITFFGNLAFYFFIGLSCRFIGSEVIPE